MQVRFGLAEKQEAGVIIGKRVGLVKATILFRNQLPVVQIFLINGASWDTSGSRRMTCPFSKTSFYRKHGSEYCG
jgi:hypothetical protein